MGSLFGGSTTKTTSHSGNYALPSIVNNTADIIGGGNAAFQTLRDFTSGGTPGYSTPDWTSYFNNNKDLQDAYSSGKDFKGDPVNTFGSPEAFAQWHYNNYGKNDGWRTLPTTNQPAQTATDMYHQTPGYQTALDSGARAIGSSQAAKGLLRSGSTLKGITKYGEDLGNQYYQSMLDNLYKQATLSTAAQGILSDAGKYSDSTQTQKSSPGIGGLLGGLLLMGATGGLGGLGLAGGGLAASGASAASAANLIGTAGGLPMSLSDRRVKTDIKKVGEHEGLGIYEWKYKFMDGRFRGVMADEVALLRPDALGPVIHGFATVNYEALGMEMETVDAY